MKTSLRRILALSPSLLALTTFVKAQTASKAPNDSDVVQLSEFTVKSEADRGYLASEAITGPRLATKIADLPYAISVITSEFMQDFDVFDFSGSLNGLAAGLTGASDEGSVTLRGTSTNNNFI